MKEPDLAFIGNESYIFTRDNSFVSVNINKHKLIKIYISTCEEDLDKINAFFSLVDYRLCDIFGFTNLDEYEAYFSIYYMNKVINICPCGFREEDYNNISRSIKEIILDRT